MAKLQVCVALLVIVAIVATVDGEITCGQVASSVAPCASYVTGMGALTQRCCNGVRSLSSAASSTPDKQAACRCLKNFAAGASSINYGLAAGLPGRCGVNVGFPISPSVDCNSDQLRNIEEDREV
ncbi:Non-specific lipid-transfer protein [Linum grandiflorum]